MSDAASVQINQDTLDQFLTLRHKTRDDLYRKFWRPKRGHRKFAANGITTQSRAKKIAEWLGVEVAALGREFRPPVPGCFHWLRLSGPDPSKVVDRSDELALLDRSWQDERARLLILHGWGGAGKSSVLDKWHESLKQTGYGGAEAVIAWSFQSDPARLLGFFPFALDVLKQDPPAGGGMVGLAEALAKAVKARRTLLVLDGLEVFQHPSTGEIRSEYSTLLLLLEWLAAGNPRNGLCVATSRLSLPHLRQAVGIHSHALPPLDDASSRELLLAESYRGPERTLKKVVRVCRGHGLTLALVGTYLREVHAGDPGGWQEIVDLAAADETSDGRAGRVMSAYEPWFRDKPGARFALELISLFRGEVDSDAVELLRKSEVGKEHRLTREGWQNALLYLRRAGFLHDPKEGHADPLDAHPIVRAHFGEQWRKGRPESWCAAHRLLYRHYLKQAKTPARTGIELLPLYAALRHGMLAVANEPPPADPEAEELTAETVFTEVAWNRICQGYQFAELHTFDTPPPEAEALRLFFGDEGFSADALTPCITAPQTRGRVLGWAATYLHVTGRFGESCRLRRAERDCLGEVDDPLGLAFNAFYHCRASLLLGNLTEARGQVDELLALIERNKLGDELMQLALYRLADVLHQQWDIAGVRRAYRKADRIKVTGAKYGAVARHLHFRRIEISIECGQADESRKRLTAERETIPAVLIPIVEAALDLASGKVKQERLRHHADQLGNVVERLDRIGNPPSLARALLTHGAVASARGEVDQARLLAGRARAVAELAGMPLVVLDCELALAELDLKTGDKREALAKLTQASESAKRLGYGRGEATAKRFQTG